MFIPNSPRPPRGMAVRDCELLLNEASTPGRKRESYHREVAGDSSVMTLEKNRMHLCAQRLWPPPKKRWAMETRITAPSVAAASE